MTEFAIATRHDASMPVLTIQDAVDRYNIIVEFTKKLMKPDRDYGKIPGSRQPSLLKPGAEKLCTLFGFTPDFVVLESIEDFDKGLFYFKYRCDLYKDGAKVGSGVGSCNSKETKYRYRFIPAEEKPQQAEADRLKALGLGKWRKINNKWVWHERIENAEPFDLVNTLDKMAQKRALIAATLVAANASEFFTQDIEDLAIVEGEFVEEESKQSTKSKTETTDLDPEPDTNGKADLYQAVVDAKLSENVHAAKNALQSYCTTGYDTPEKAVAWMKLYRGWRDSGLEPVEAAAYANNGKPPK